jgi:hypothetical protein
MWIGPQQPCPWSTAILVVAVPCSALHVLFRRPTVQWFAFKTIGMFDICIVEPRERIAQRSCPGGQSAAVLIWVEDRAADRNLSVSRAGGRWRTLKTQQRKNPCRLLLRRHLLLPLSTSDKTITVHFPAQLTYTDEMYQPIMNVQPQPVTREQFLRIPGHITKKCTNYLWIDRNK